MPMTIKKLKVILKARKRSFERMLGHAVAANEGDKAAKLKIQIEEVDMFIWFLRDAGEQS